MTITLKRDATCKECGSTVKAGQRAKWYRNGDVYGLECHGKGGLRTSAEDSGLRSMTDVDSQYENWCAEVTR